MENVSRSSGGETKQRSRVSNSRGVATVEMALMLPVLLLLLIGVIDVSRAAFVGIAVYNAASAGAFHGAQSPSKAADTTAVTAFAAADAQVSGMSVSVSTYCVCSDGTASTCLATDCAASRRMDFIQVDTSAPWTPIFSYPGIPGAVPLRASSVVQIAE